MTVRIVRLGSKRVPGEGLLKAAQASMAVQDERAWKAFVRGYRAEMMKSDHRASVLPLHPQHRPIALIPVIELG